MDARGELTASRARYASMPASTSFAWMLLLTWMFYSCALLWHFNQQGDFKAAICTNRTLKNL